MKNGLQKGMSLSFKVICIAFILFHLYTAYFGVVQGNGQKTIHLGFILLVCYPHRRSEQHPPLPPSPHGMRPFAQELHWKHGLPLLPLSHSAHRTHKIIGQVNQISILPCLLFCHML